MVVSSIWDKTLNVLKNKMNRPGYEVFVKRILPVSYTDNILYLEIPTTLSMDYFEEFRTIIEDAVGSVVNEKVQIVAKQSDILAATQYVETEEPAYKPVQVESPSPKQQQKLFLNPRYKFDAFVVGGNNRLPHAAALAVAEAPGKAYNPLFIYGGVGLGKTHLMQAVGHYVHETRPNLSIMYITTDAFINEVVTSIQENRLMDFRNHFQKTDLLLVDDIQFIQGKDRTQYEFFQIFNNLHESRKQIVVTCDRLPKDIPTLEDRLVSRLSWGLITDVKPPDYETRLAILQKKLISDEMEVPDGVLELVASKIVTNIRDLEGTLNRIIAFSNLSSQEITLELVEKLIRDIVPTRMNGKVSVDHIVNVVCDYFDMDKEDLLGKRRKKEIVLPRRIAMYLCRELTDLSLEKIGNAFAKDHSTVLYSCDTLRKEMIQDPNLAQTVETIQQKLSN